MPTLLATAEFYLTLPSSLDNSCDWSSSTLPVPRVISCNGTSGPSELLRASKVCGAVPGGPIGTYCLSTALLVERLLFLMIDYG